MMDAGVIKQYASAFIMLAAAAMLMWGFLVAWVLLVWGWVRRQTDNFTSLIAILAFIGAPVKDCDHPGCHSPLGDGHFCARHLVAEIERCEGWPRLPVLLRG
mgnify:CR=1 FL=1